MTNDEKEALRATKLKMKEEKQKKKDAKELAKWEKEKARPRSKAYFWFLLAILTLVYIVDEVATNIPNNVQSNVVNEFFVNGMGMTYDQGLATFSSFTFISYLLMVLAFFYKTLSDRYGRKIFLATNTLGMAVGLILCSWSGQVWIYILGTFVINFFISHDMQVVYIMECAPKKNRATVYSIIKGIAEFGMLLIPLMRKVFLKSDDPSSWRLVFLVPAIIGLVISIISFFFCRETDVFVDQRLAYLRMTDEEKAALKANKNKKTDKAQGGLFHAIKFAMVHKQTRWLFLATFAFTLCAICNSYYNSIMSEGGMSDETITNALYFFPISCGILTLAYGLFSDKVGRKLTCILMASICVVSFALFITGVKYQWAPWLIGSFVGLYLGAYWGTTDTYILMISESTPTNLRASVMSAQTIFYGVGMLISVVTGIVVLAVIPNVDIGLFCLILAIPTMIISLIMIMLGTKETKGIDLDTVTGEEWDKKPATK